MGADAAKEAAAKDGRMGADAKKAAGAAAATAAAAADAKSAAAGAAAAKKANKPQSSPAAAAAAAAAALKPQDDKALKVAALSQALNFFDKFRKNQESKEDKSRGRRRPDAAEIDDLASGLQEASQGASAPANKVANLPTAILNMLLTITASPPPFPPSHAHAGLPVPELRRREGADLGGAERGAPGQGGQRRRRRILRRRVAQRR